MLMIGYHSYRRKEWLDSLPLFAAELNTALIWSFLSCYEVGNFNYMINKTPMVNGDPVGFKNLAIKSMLENSYVLQPLTLFLYTWRFITTLEREEENKI
jgi:hypothetical protein